MVGAAASQTMVNLEQMMSKPVKPSETAIRRVQRRAVTSDDVMHFENQDDEKAVKQRKDKKRVSRRTRIRRSSASMSSLQ